MNKKQEIILSRHITRTCFKTRIIIFRVSLGYAVIQPDFQNCGCLESVGESTFSYISYNSLVEEGSLPPKLGRRCTFQIGGIGEESGGIAENLMCIYS